MNRVFAPEAPIDLDPIAEGSPHQRPPQPPAPPMAALGSKRLSMGPAGADGGARRPPARPIPTLAVVLVALLGGMGLAGAISTLLLVRQWAGLQSALSQERNLLLVERLRALGPASGVATTPLATDTPPPPLLDPIQPANPSALTEGLPQPRPGEPWMDRLTEVPAPRVGLPPLRVPVSPVLKATAPPPASTPVPRSPARAGQSEASTGKTPSGSLPQLVGLVGAPGRAGSAIFQVGDTSTNVNVGEAIGSSGWRLRAADAESALIERGTEVRRIAIVAGG